MILNWWFLLEIHVVWYVFFTWDPPRGKNSSVGIFAIPSRRAVGRSKSRDSWADDPAIGNHPKRWSFPNLPIIFGNQLSLSRFSKARILEATFRRGWKSCFFHWILTNIPLENWWFGVDDSFPFNNGSKFQGRPFLLSFRAVSIFAINLTMGT